MRGGAAPVLRWIGRESGLRREDRRREEGGLRADAGRQRSWVGSGVTARVGKEWDAPDIYTSNCFVGLGFMC